MPSQRGTSRSYVIQRLRKTGRPDLADAIKRGEASSYDVAIALGWQRRKKPLGTGSENQARRRYWRLRALGL